MGMAPTTSTMDKKLWEYGIMATSMMIILINDIIIILSFFC